MTIQDLRMVLFGDDTVTICNIGNEDDGFVYSGEVKDIPNGILNLTVLKLVPYIQQGAAPITNTAVMGIYVK